MPFTPKPHEPGSSISWRHLLPDGREVERTGTVVGRAPALGAGHSREVWVVADEPMPSDLYTGGLVVAVATGRGPRAVGGQRVEAGEVFSENAASSPTGGLSVTNARLSWQARAAA
jgi:hypothetical protein